MASRNEPNGTARPSSTLLTPLPSSPSPESHKRARTASPAPRPVTLPQTPSPNQSRHDTHIDTNQGQSSVPRPTPHIAQLPAWDPASLLDPKAFVVPPQANAQPQPTRPSPNNATHADPVTIQFSTRGPLDFQFSTPGLSEYHAHPSRPPSADSFAQSQPYTGQNGIGTMIERMNNVQDRSSVPVPKRRKVEQGLEGVNGKQAGFHGSSSGMLGEYMKQNQQEGQAGPSFAQFAPLDLTSDNGSTTPLLSRVESVDLTEGDNEDVAQDNKYNEEVCYGMVDGVMVNCHSVPAPKIKAIQPGYWPQVKVVLKRQFRDKTNTIQVYDHTREVFGNIDPQSAEWLVRLLDSPLFGARSDCLIGPRPRLPGEEVGQPVSRHLKLQVILYGKHKYINGVGAILAHYRLKILTPTRVDKGVRFINPLQHENRVTVVPRQRQAYEPAPAPPIARTVEEVRSEILTVFDSLAHSESLPELEPSHDILTPLLKHQKQGLYFMTGREDPSSSAQYANTIWKQKRGNTGNVYYSNIITGEMAREPPTNTLGGILADMMGLGKTLSILSLVKYTQDKSEKWMALEPVQPGAPPARKTGQSSNHFNPPKAEPFGLTKVKRNSKATLLVCPLSTITNWEEQIKQHIKPGTCKYHIYHGAQRVKDVDTLASFDLVITTYGSVSSEVGARSKGKRGPHPLEEIGWFRIVLDEAHIIREQSTLQFKAICRLPANRRWAVTGTPVQNKLEDLAALLAFLRLKPFDDRNKFAQYIVAPFKLCDPEIVPKLRILVDTITLRRLKDKIDLPKRHDLIKRLDFSPDERRVYDVFEKNAQDRVKVLTNRTLGGKTYIHILQAILRMRLLCAHGKDLLNENDMQLLEGMTQDSAIDLDSDDDDQKPVLHENKAYEMYNLMKETNHDVCFVCNRKMGANESADIESERQEDLLGFMTPCLHLLCTNCIGDFRDDNTGANHQNKAQGTCPLCQASERFACVELRSSRAEEEHDMHVRAKGAKLGRKTFKNYSGPHTKTQWLIEQLLGFKEQSEQNPDEPPYKSVVFSGWTSHLDLIEIALDKIGITHTRLDGTMQRSARKKAMDSFREDPAVQVILVSISAGGLGLNLTTANSVYVMEPQFNPAAEAQAIDRVHRLGQKREVQCVRLVMNDSFEEKMLELQDKKNKLANLSMDRDGGREALSKAEAAKQRLMDIRSLFK